MKTIVFLADGFEECEALIVVDILRRAGNGEPACGCDREGEVPGVF
jgi:putative intracellular protease/amidase